MEMSNIGILPGRHFENGLKGDMYSWLFTANILISYKYTRQSYLFWQNWGMLRILY